MISGFLCLHLQIYIFCPDPSPEGQTWICNCNLAPLPGWLADISNLTGLKLSSDLSPPLTRSTPHMHGFLTSAVGDFVPWNSQTKPWEFSVYRNVAKIFQGVLYIFTATCPNINTLRNHSTITKTRKITLSSTIKKISDLAQILSVVLLLFQSTTQDPTLQFCLRVVLVSSRLWQFLNLPLTLLKSTSQLFSRTSFNLELSDNLRLDWGYIFWLEYHRSDVPVLVHHIRGTWCQYVLLLMMMLLTWSTWLGGVWCVSPL